MKISGKFILKVAGTLTVISLVVAALLGLVDNVTADKIAAIDAENTRIAMSAVAPEGSEFGDKLDITDDMTAAAASQGGKLVELYPMTTAGADNGYVMKISASGSQGSIVMMVGVDADKAITGISVVSHSETSGIGTKVVENKPNAAGTPVLEAIGHAGLSDVIVVVTRYFGGVLLGTGGLVRAYTAAASGALQQAEIVSMRLVTDCAVTVPYPKFEQAQRMIAAAGAKLQEPEYADAVTLRWRMPAGTEEALCHDLSELTRGSAEVTISKPLYAAF